MMTNFPNYDAIETLSSINVVFQALHQQALPFFQTPAVEVQNDKQKADRLAQTEIIKLLAVKLKVNAEKILEALKN